MTAINGSIHVSLICLGLISSFASSALGDITLTGRSSQFHYDHVYGFGGDTASGPVDSLNTDFLAADSMAVNFHGENSGFYPPLGQGWFASSTIQGSHEYQTVSSDFRGGH